MTSYEGLAGLPPFNPDLDTDGGKQLPPAAVDLRARVGWADGLLISSPEYAQGIPGASRMRSTGLSGVSNSPASPSHCSAPHRVRSTSRRNSPRC